jgi:cell division protein ZapA
MILGEEYRIGGEAAGASVSELAAYVDRKIKEVRQQSSVTDPKRVAVLASLNLADELFRERAVSASLLDEVRRRVERLDSLLKACGADGTAS